MGRYLTLAIAESAKGEYLASYRKEEEKGTPRLGADMNISRLMAIGSFFGVGASLDAKTGTCIVSIRMPLYEGTYAAIGEIAGLAERDDAVKRVVFDINSPGGAFTGVVACARRIASMSKPHCAYVAGLGASAAYLLACAAGKDGQLFMDKTGEVGSVGVYCAYYDDSEYLKKMGVIERVFRSRHAGKKNLDPATDEGAEEVQKGLDSAERYFVSAIAELRGKTSQEVIDGFGQGLVFDSEEALARGMADEAVDSLEACVDRFASTEDGGEEDDMDISQMKDEELLSALNARPELMASIKQEAVAAERARIAGLMKLESFGAYAVPVVKEAIASGESRDAVIDRLLAAKEKDEATESDAQAKAREALQKSAEEAVGNTPEVKPTTDKEISAVDKADAELKALVKNKAAKK